MAEHNLFGTDAGTSDARRGGVAAGAGGTPRLRVPDRQQVVWDPSSLDERLAADHPARTIWAVVQRMDLSALLEQVEARGSTPGRPATDPRLLTALLLLASTEGVGSCREVARRCERDIAYQWLCGGVSVNHHLLSDFRVGHEKVVDQLLTDTLAALAHQGLVKVERVTQDGVRVRAGAGRGSFRRGQTLEKLRQEAHRHVQELKTQQDDPQLNARVKAARERAARERLGRIEQALALLPAAEAAKARHTGKPSKDRPPRVSTTDPEACRMKTGTGAVLPAWNVQLASDPVSRAVVGVIVGNSGGDAQYAGPMRQQVQGRTGGVINEHLIDGGYFNKDELEAAHEQGVKVYMPLPKPTEKRPDPAAPVRGDGPGTLAWRARMTEDAAKEIYKQRAGTSETINADLTTHRGLSPLRVRGAGKVRCVALWSVLAYNLMHFAGALLA